MTHSVKVYGFGSAFVSNKVASDIDLLVLHTDKSPASCQLAIRCKGRLRELLGRAHVTMLSAREEEHFRFIDKVRATPLGTIRDGQIDEDLSALFDVPVLAVYRDERLKPRANARSRRDSAKMKMLKGGA